ncbi:MAG: hypothetical protein JST54_34890 [Deltaproteobacteria bacterium]|nr:hypothetical protein [Deltaproteobacteria bacterium]
MLRIAIYLVLASQPGAGVASDPDGGIAAAITSAGQQVDARCLEKLDVFPGIMLEGIYAGAGVCTWKGYVADGVWTNVDAPQAAMNHEGWPTADTKHRQHLALGWAREVLFRYQLLETPDTDIPKADWAAPIAEQQPDGTVRVRAWRQVPDSKPKRTYQRIEVVFDASGKPGNAKVLQTLTR